MRYLWLPSFLLITACFSADTDLLPPQLENQEVDKSPLSNEYYIAFGFDAGYCPGQDCRKLYILERDSLYEDIGTLYVGTADWPNEESEIINLGLDKFEVVKELSEKVPDSIYSYEIGTYNLGCPNCTDQGAFFLEFMNNKEVRTFWIDPYQEEIPDFIVPYLNLIQEKLDYLRLNEAINQ